MLQQPAPGQVDLLDDLLQAAEKRFSGEGHQPAAIRGFETFSEWVCRVSPEYRFYRHTKLLCDIVQRIADGHLKRVMIWIPPGTSKSETVSRLFAAYYLYRFPAREVGLVSYGASLAEDLAGDAREYYVAAGGELDDSTHAKGDWATTAGGGMWGKGFGGAIRGRRYHLGIVDDPHKGPEELESEALGSKFPRWWQRTWLNRQNLFFEEGASIVVIMQRLATNDLCGWLLEQPDAAQWTIVALDAVRSDEPWQQCDPETGEDIGEIPMCCDVVPDWREPGELLCPELLSLERLAEQTGDVMAYNAQYLQRPVPASSQMFQRQSFTICTPQQVPPLLVKVLGVDLAVTEKTSADYTVGFPMGWAANGLYYLFNPYRKQAEAPDAHEGIVNRALQFGADIIAVEQVAFQASFVQYLRRDRRLVGCVLLGVPADKDKVARAKGWSPFAGAGQIVLVDDGSGWIEKFFAELLKFPRSKNKDQVDTVGICFAAMRTGGKAGKAMVGGVRSHPAPSGMR
jgi:predicted phage terminase large subunit-like protein